MGYDVVVVGAGFAGSSLAYFLSMAGVKALVVDVRGWDDVGDRPCGDAIGKHHFDELGMPYPKGEELEGLVKGIAVYSPSELLLVVRVLKLIVLSMFRDYLVRLLVGVVNS
jgi:flavin-dependent dehydrogenase